MKKIQLSVWMKWLYGVLFLMAFGILIYIGLHENAGIVQERDTKTSVTIGTYQYHEEQNADSPLGYDRIYEFYPGDIRGGDCSLAFYTVYHNVRVYLDGQLAYSNQPDPSNRITHTGGCYWAVVMLRASDQGKKIRVELTPAYQSVQNRKIEFMIGSYEKIYQRQLLRDLPQIVVSLIAIITGVIFIGCGVAGWVISKKGNGKPDQSLWYLGIFSILMGIWKITDTRWIALQFPDHTLLLSYVSLSSLMLLGISFVMLLITALEGWGKRLFRFLGLCEMIFLFLLFLLQIAGILEFRSVLWAVQLWLCLDAVVILLVMAVRFWHNRGKTGGSAQAGLLLLCAVGVIADLSSYYIKGNSTGNIFTVSAFLICTVCMGSVRIVRFMEQDKKLKEQEAELADGRIRIMLSQIQPHFLYNSLNSIYHLCAVDPQRAQQAISDFSDYLRGNLNSLTRTSLIGFEQELEHIRLYLSLEKMRFEDRLKIEYDIQTTDFRIPALTIQPLVENAIKHGISKKEEGGIVKITARKREDGYEVIVSDNGNGYDESVINKDGRIHVGIMNVRSRLEQMCQGKLLVESEPGKGTRACVWIPIHNK